MDQTSDRTPEPLFHSQMAPYLTGLVKHNDPLLAEMEARAEKENFPIVGPAAGQFCYLMTRLAGARSVFEMGSGFGYSTLWFARAVADNGGGEVHHTVWQDDLSQQAQDYFTRAGLPDTVKTVFRMSEAIEALTKLSESFDVIFVDINKEAYPEAIRLAEKRLQPGGMLILDNMLWAGRLFADQPPDDPAGQGIIEATRMLFDSPAWISTLIPIRDGLAVARLQK